MDRIQSIYKPDPEIHEEKKPLLPNVERDFQLAKRYLQKLSDENETLWSHLIELIHKIMVSKKEVMTPAELHNICRRLRERKLQVTDWLVDLYQDQLYLSKSEELIDLYTKPKYKWNWEERVPDNYPIVDEKYIVKMRMKKTSGFTLPDREIFTIMMSMRVLSENIKVAKISFWGKIFGVMRDYYIIECDVDPAELERMAAEEQERLDELKAKEEEERLEKEKLDKEEQEKLAKEEKAKKEKDKREKRREKRRKAEMKKQALIEKQERLKQKRIELAKRLGRSLGEIGEDLMKAELEGEARRPKKEKPLEEEAKPEEVPPPPPESLFTKYAMPKLPVSKPKITVEVPSEPYGEGLNKREYYVCNEPGQPWIKLPDVTPKQIQVARRITKFVTGDLEADVISMPPFPGQEKSYLRAMIARISNSTQVSPVGYYSGGGEEGLGEEEEDAGGGGTEAALNPDYHGVAWTKLFDKSQAFWAHHSPFILPQGRLKWWRPPKITEEGDEGEGGEGDEIKPEKGPPILRTITRDASNDAKPWSLISSSVIFTKGVAITARSNLWPGAMNTAVEFNYQYLYVGWGLKFSQYGYTPPFLHPPHPEYEIGPEILEIQDPTPEEEEAWRIAHMPKVPKPFAGEGGEGEEGIGGGLTEDEDDDEEEEEEEE